MEKFLQRIQIHKPIVPNLNKVDKKYEVVQTKENLAKSKEVLP